MLLIKLILIVVFFAPLQSVVASENKECGNKLVYCQVSIINLIASPETYNNKNVIFHGYLFKAPKGPYHGYWITIDNQFFDRSSAIKLHIPKSAPHNKWIKDKSYYSFVGRFEDCDELNCRPSLKMIDGEHRLVIPMLEQ